ALVGREAPVLVRTTLIVTGGQGRGHCRDADAAVAGVERGALVPVLPALARGLSLALGLARVSVHCRLQPSLVILHSPFCAATGAKLRSNSCPIVVSRAAAIFPSFTD